MVATTPAVSLASMVVPVETTAVMEVATAMVTAMVTAMETAEEETEVAMEAETEEAATESVQLLVS